MKERWKRLLLLLARLVLFFIAWGLINTVIGYRPAADLPVWINYAHDLASMCFGVWGFHILKEAWT